MAALVSFYCFFELGGEGGIRTLGTLPYTHFPGVLFRPLRHLTVFFLFSLFSFLSFLSLPFNTLNALSRKARHFILDAPLCKAVSLHSFALCSVIHALFLGLLSAAQLMIIYALNQLLCLWCLFRSILYLLTAVIADYALLLNR